MPNNIDVDELAEKYEGISGSEIANAILMAAFKAARSLPENFYLTIRMSKLKRKKLGAKSELIPELKEFIATKMRGLSSAIAFFDENIKTAWTAIKCKVFFRDNANDKWYEKEGVKEISESAVPAGIRAKLKREREQDVTEIMELETGVSVG